VKRLAFSLCVAALAFTGGFSNRSSANDWTTLVSDEEPLDMPLLSDALENTQIFGGFDTYKSVGDRLTNINGGTGSLSSSYGNTVGFNTGFGLGGLPFRGQIGASYGVYDYKGRLGIVEHSEQVEQQMFVTTGLYKRGDMTNEGDPISWGFVYDLFYADEWGINGNEFDLGQFRAIIGYALTDATEIGVWGTFAAQDNEAAVTVAGVPNLLRTIRSANQANIYLKQNFEFGGQITGYTGMLDNASIGDWQFGLLGQAPLSDSWSVYGNSNYVVPSAKNGPNGSGEEQFNVSVGLAYSFGGKARNQSVTGNAGMPLLNVANNGSFLVTD